MLRMKTAGVALLLLWSGQCVTAASSEALQTTGTGKDSPPQQDIHNVPREMSSLITVELWCTKTQLETVEKKVEAMEERLRASEKKAEAMESRLRASESKAEAMESRLRASESLVNQLKIANKAQAMGLSRIVTDVSNLKKEREQSRVSFSASLAESGVSGGNFGPYSVDTPLAFKNDFTNIGNAYNANTGVFTAPIRGVYFFAVFILGQGSKSTSTAVWLFKNGYRFATAWTQQFNGYPKSSTGGSVLMEKGDRVYAKVPARTWLLDNYYHHSVFSGHMLFPM